MKKLFVLAAAITIMSIRADAQQSAGGRYNDNYGMYYSPVVIGPNGFRTVDEENRLMAETLAERKRQNDRETHSAEELAKAKKQHDRDVADKKALFDAKKNDNAKTKK